jgi:tetratricopeptide (TPR) repeat protein
MPDSIQSVNTRAIELRGQGRLGEAVAVFSEGIVHFPDAAVLYNNLAMTLDEMGLTKEALLAYDSALMRAPHLTASLVGKAGILLRDGLIDEARKLYEEALIVEPASLAAHLGMYELLQIKGDLHGAVEHQRRALERHRLFSHRAPNEQRSVLVLLAPGDWQANVPVDFLFDRQTTSVHKLYLIDEKLARAEMLPDYDVVFNAIAESDESVEVLRLARAFVDAQSKASLNAPERVLGVGRRRLPQTLAGVDCVVPAVIEVPRDDLARGKCPIDYPAIVRPVGSHAGHQLERVTSDAELADYVARVDARAFFVSPFVDYSNGDGYFRKYRIVFVDGEPYPVHLAISPNWMIHYYNAPMSENEWMRTAEAAFLADLSSSFGGALAAALSDVAVRIGLEYFGIDCSIDRDGRLLIFEADPAMLVHTSDPVDLFPYKQQYIPRIFRALEAMLDKRKGLRL